MKLRALLFVLSLGPISAAAQIGAGNANAAALAQKSPAVQTAQRFLVQQAQQLQDANLRAQTLDAISNPNTCIRHRANLTPAKQAAIVQQLLAAGLLDPTDDAKFPGGLQNGVFPPVVNDGTACPQLPMPFYAAPGSAFGSHHSYPGGLPIHEANNDSSDVELAGQYRSVYLHKEEGVVALNPGLLHDGPATRAPIFIDQDLIIGAPLWHDWAKPIVFQWNADGSEFPELNIGGNGLTDNNGAAGNSKTGGHHILSIAESMARGLSPAFVITQASAHSNPTLGNEYKVVNWILAAAIIDGIDPIATGYLTVDSLGHPRLPALRSLGDINLNAAGQTNLLVEYELHNLSDADFTFSIPAVGETQVILQTLASRYGYDTTNVAVYNNSFRNPVLSYLTGERILILYSQSGWRACRRSWTSCARRTLSSAGRSRSVRRPRGSLSGAAFFPFTRKLFPIRRCKIPPSPSLRIGMMWRREGTHDASPEPPLRPFVVVPRMHRGCNPAVCRSSRGPGCP